MEAREEKVETAIILMDAAVKIYKTLGVTKDEAKAEVMRVQPAGVPSFVVSQMEFLFDSRWETVDG